MNKTNKLSVILIAVILFIGFISGSMGVWGAALTAIGVPIFVHGGYILIYGQDIYKILELGMDPNNLNFEYQGNGKYVNPKTGAWVQYYDHAEQQRQYRKGTDSVKSFFIVYGVILILAMVVMQFNSTAMSDEELYDRSITILEDEFVNDEMGTLVDMRITYPNIEHVQFEDLEDDFRGITGQFTDQFGERAKFGVGIQVTNGKVSDYWWVVEYKGMQWTSWE